MSEAVSRFEAPTATEGRFAAQAGGKAIAGAPATPERNLAMGYLKAFITLLVVAHHAAIAYVPGLPKTGPVFTKPPMLWSVFPIEDAGHTFAPFGVFVSVNDIFFMSLMFFISGLFVWDSLKRKGAAGFVRDRLLRLGLPFAVAASLLAPLAYYPAYLQTGANPAPAALLARLDAPGRCLAGRAGVVHLGAARLRFGRGRTLSRRAALGRDGCPFG